MVVLLVLSLGIKELPAMTIEHLGQPCRARNVLGGRAVVDPAGGREWFVMTNMNENTGGELIFVDYEGETAQVFRAPSVEGSWAVIEVPGDRLAMGTFDEGTFVVFDLKKMAFIKTIRFPGEEYVWNLALGSDGRVYGGTYDGGKLGALDLKTFALEDCGAAALPNLYLRKVSALPDGRILCWYTCEKQMLLVYDPKTKQFSPAPDAMKGSGEGAVWNGYFVIGDKVFDGSLAEVKPLPLPAPPAEKGAWSVEVDLTGEDRLFLRQGQAIYRYEKGDKELTLVADFDLRGGKLLAANRKGEILGIRGQDYFVLRAGDKKLNLKPIPGENSPRPTHFLRVDDRNRLWGGPQFGQTLFRMDLKTKEAVNTATVCDIGGEVYDVAFRGGKVYGVAYAGGDIIEYQPDQPWNQWDNKNPKTLVHLESKGYVRPQAGMCFGPGGKLYSGWWAGYGTYGGAVAITDPESGATELIENPFGKQAVHGLAADENLLYVGTSLHANGMPIQKDASPAFGVIDPTTKKVLFEKRFEKVVAVHSLQYDSRTKQVVMAIDEKLAFFDTIKREFGELPEGTPNVTGGLVVWEGKAFYGSDKSIIEVDLSVRTFRTFMETPTGVGHMAIGPDGTIYFSSGTDVYRVRRQEK
jgi:hypothetical protein